MQKQWLPLGWKVMKGWGIFNMIFAVMVPLVSLYYDPTIFTFGPDDARFVGMSWDEVAMGSQHMGLWMILMMVSMCSLHIGYAILTAYVAGTPYRKGERWAWKALAYSLGAFTLYSAWVGVYYFREGIYGFFTTSGFFPSGVSVGLPTLIVMIAVFYVGLWLPRKEIKSE